MLTGVLNSIREEKASLARDVEYIREMAREDAMEDRLMDLEILYSKPEGNVFKEAAEIGEHMSSEDDFSEVEMARILNADHDITFDEMIGINE